jgi:glycosyltransferase involved in cell wall biosynthesis
MHGVISRASWKLNQVGVLPYLESWLQPMFGRWACAELSNEDWDVIHCWSGVSEESLRALVAKTKLRLIMRGSAHIRTQARLLAEEQARTGATQEQPTPWIIAREEREYALADRIIVLSTFAYNSFLSEGISPENLRPLLLGARLNAFHPKSEVVEARYRHILSGKPLRILYVGTISFRKGLWDLAAITQKLSGDQFQFSFVGPESAESVDICAGLKGQVTFIPKQPQSKLPEIYAHGDVFVFPTIEDGYAQVLAQAAASGLPILTTTNCAGSDLIREGETGWVLPIRSPEAFIERLQWCATHRAELAEMARRIPAQFQPRDWADVAADFEKICLESLNEQTSVMQHNLEPA